MKYFLIIILFFISCDKNNFKKKTISPTLIDSLETKNEVENYIRSLKYPNPKRNIKMNIPYLGPNFLEKFQLKKINEFDRNSSSDIDRITKNIADSLNISESFYKTDIDNNGYTDLLIIGDNMGCTSFDLTPNSSRSCDFSTYVFMNFGNEPMKIYDLGIEPRHSSFVPEINENNKGVFINVHFPPQYHTNGKIYRKYKKHILTYSFDDFIEYNDTPKKYSIEKIEFRVNKKYFYELLCDYIILTIDKFNSAQMEIYDDNPIFLDEKKPKKHLSKKIKESEFKEINSLLNYIDFPELNNNYSYQNLHSSSCVLKITYNNNLVKEIRDNDMFGTYGLKKIYEALFDLNQNQGWVEKTTANKM